MRRIDTGEGMRAVSSFAAGETLSPAQLRTAARFCLEEIAERHPGRSVEVRVPYIGAVQVLEGVRHRRGTPPNVVELDGQTWLDLCVGNITWEQAVAAGRISASGTRADLAEFMPLFGSAVLRRWTA
ncbi:MAG: hypothetical protein E7Z96_07705 [Actinomycetaceae bacterium]|nr:hypothetical protein [Actinomycetaceae bacterium]